MKSALPKVLHPILSRPMVEWVVDAARATGASPIILVVGYGADEVRAHFADQPDVYFAIQEQQLGTGDAVRAGLEVLPESVDSVLVLCGDVPLIPHHELDALASAQAGNALSVLTFKASPPHGYGRMLRQGEQLLGIVEAKDASADQLEIDECNSGTYCFDASFLRTHISGLTTDNAQGELYLTDLVAAAQGSARGVLATDSARLAGANDRVDLAGLTKRAQTLINDALMRQGVTFEDPENTWVDAGVEVSQDTFLATGVRLAGATRVGANCQLAQGVVVTDSIIDNGAQIHAYSVLESARVASGCSVGPFARLRPGAELGKGARIGNYVEVKNASFGEGAKANHLAYIGDAQVGAGSNIGAGTITCNYDGANKHRTTIGEGSFVGSNSTLVAPVTIEDKSYVGAGSVVTRTVPKGALGVGRTKQRNIEGWVARAAPKKDK